MVTPELEVNIVTGASVDLTPHIESEINPCPQLTSKDTHAIELYDEYEQFERQIVLESPQKYEQMSSHKRSSGGLGFVVGVTNFKALSGVGAPSVLMFRVLLASAV